MKEVTTFELAKLAKEKGFNELCWGEYDEKTEVYEHDPTSTPECSNCNIGYIAAPSYSQLIDWVFDRTVGFFEAKISWLEFWYNHLKDCPLKYEFKGRLLEWFKYNGFKLEIRTGANSRIWYSRIHYSNGLHKKETKDFGDNPKEAEHQGILEVFKLLKE